MASVPASPRGQAVSTIVMEQALSLNPHDIHPALEPAPLKQVRQQSATVESEELIPRDENEWYRLLMFRVPLVWPKLVEASQACR